MAPFVAGARRIIITPPVGVDLTGFGGRDAPSQGVHDDLRACALYVCSGDSQALIIAADLIGLHHEEVALIRSRIEARCGIPAEAIMVGCSHTHSGPATRCLYCLGQQDEEYLAALVDRLVGLAAWTKEGAVPARSAAFRAPVCAGINRRELRDGHIVLGINPEGPTAPWVDVLCVDDLNGAPLARLFCHAAHPVTLGGRNLLISGDWPGYAQRAVEAAVGGDCVALFLQGCCGNINSHPMGSFAEAEDQGRRVAAAVASGACCLEWDEAPAVRTAIVHAELPLQDPPPPCEARALRESLEAQVEANRGTDNYGVSRMRAGIVEWAKTIERLAQAPEPARMLPFAMQGVRVGDFACVGLPGEVFVEYALALDEASEFTVTAVSAYNNGNVGYIPTAAAYAEGGYEVESAVQFYGTTNPRPESEGLILQAGRRLLERL